jgi:hypothetical protein
MYRQLDSQKIVQTIQTLQSRITERFPDSGLSKLAGELNSVAQETIKRLCWIQRPNVALRIMIMLLLAAIFSIFIVLLTTLRVGQINEMATFIQVLEAGLSAMFFIGASVVFLVTWETRIKRTRALRSLHELRAMAHIVDMHQLTKDPDSFLFGRVDTASSPKRVLTPFALSRYLDYCSELLSMISKIAALYAQGLDDPVVLNAVDDIEDLASELSQKIWQKITILDTVKLQESEKRA